MKKLQVILTAVALIFIIYGTASALYIDDETIFNAGGTTPTEDYSGHGRGDVNLLDGIGDWVAWTHHFEFTPPVDTILSAELTIFLRDDERDSWNPLTWELGAGIAEDGTWDIGGVNTGSYKYNVNVSNLYDGAFSVKLVSLLGDFFIDESYLKINYTADDVSVYNSVPEPDVFFILGPVLIALGFWGRRKAQKQIN